MMTDDQDWVVELVKSSGTSFYQGMKILPPLSRAAIYAIYGFCRLVDDTADAEGTLEHKRAKLEGWRQKIEEVYRGNAEDALSRELVRAVKKFNLKKGDFYAVIDGMEMDIETPICAPDLATLDLYCDRVASAVGRLAVLVFGDSSDNAKQVACHLGRALQKTNILRDLVEDAASNRLYLPREWLIEAHVPLTPKEAVISANLPIVTRKLATEAADHFKKADYFMSLCNKKAMRPARIMKANYYAVYQGLAKQGFKALPYRLRLSKPQKIRLALSALMK